MSESEKRLREWLALGTKAAEVDVLRELDAALASARNAALEEAARAIHGHRSKVVGERRAALDTAEETVRVLKSAPVALLDAQKVREVLLALRASALDPRSVGISHDRASGRLDFVVLAAERLGLPLDAEGAGEPKGDVCRHWRGWGESCTPCGRFPPREPAAGEHKRRESTYPPEYEATGELTLASQMDRAEETCHLCPRPKHPGSSCYGGNEDGHRRDAEGCMADCPGCASEP